MKKLTTIYLALGSNQGDKKAYLQKALTEVFEHIGQITAVSKIYKTPAWGFEGEDFLNACIAVKTRFSAEETLQKILEIELQLGRKRFLGGYQNRTIDIDIIFYGNTSVASSTLEVPHPKLAERKFVLYPLADIASEVIHPKLGKSIATLVHQTSDNSSIEVVSESLNIPTIKIDTKYLAIEGNIGAGKTSLATMIAQDFNAELITERFKDNPFLPKFYKDKKRYAFPLEMSFLADRYQQLIDDISQHSLFSDFIVADYDIYKSMIFAGVTLQEEEFVLYKKLFTIMYNNLSKPDLYVYLYQNTERLLQNIKKRGRTYEQAIPAAYLDKINTAYLNFIKTQHHFKASIIDISAIDFVENRKDYLSILRQLSNLEPV